MKIFVVLEDDTIREFGIGDSVQSLIRTIHKEQVANIVVGEIKAKGGKVIWEKQFKPVTVMPSSFGRK